MANGSKLVRGLPLPKVRRNPQRRGIVNTRHLKCSALRQIVCSVLRRWVRAEVMALKHWMEKFRVFHYVKWPGVALVSVPSHKVETPLTDRTGPILRGDNSHSRKLLTRLLHGARPDRKQVRTPFARAGRVQLLRPLQVVTRSMNGPYTA